MHGSTAGFAGWGQQYAIDIQGLPYPSYLKVCVLLLRSHKHQQVSAQRKHGARATMKKECEQLKAGGADKADKAEEVAERQAEKTPKPRL
jgi:hypothetical protein